MGERRSRGQPDRTPAQDVTSVPQNPVPTPTCRSLHTPPPRSRGHSQGDSLQPLPTGVPSPGRRAQEVQHQAWFVGESWRQVHTRQEGGQQGVCSWTRGHRDSSVPSPAQRGPQGQALTLGSSTCSLSGQQGLCAPLPPGLLTWGFSQPCRLHSVLAMSPHTQGLQFHPSWLAGGPGSSRPQPCRGARGKQGTGTPTWPGRSDRAPQMGRQRPPKAGSLSSVVAARPARHGGPRLSRLRGGLEEAGSASNTNRPRCPLQALRGGHHKPGAQRPGARTQRLHTWPGRDPARLEAEMPLSPLLAQHPGSHRSGGRAGLPPHASWPRQLTHICRRHSAGL